MRDNPMRLRLAALILVVCTMPLLVSATVRIENRHLRIGLDESTGTLLELTDMRTDRNMIVADTTAPRALWTLRLGSGAQHTNLSPTDAGAVRCTRSARRSAGFRTR